ncbi:tripartite tricarboxylate transporter substrate binding protein [Polynucleobacter sp. 71A-WALBACH]|uniref:Bug family tripartite tricarboxylate transporter substrate binding protein n=1 Tax=Polynucleobacter sp. 71A-WALBACH TaxID=2689097 RepID=UPI001C0E70AE|nr:tripartite tricarboxylate transporter substrate binding protein [Polynucleobacter sp. 71A-WALBACH]MBU3594301.1 tripartite tricarboxylate transporter substrate binding protein [Polynucleobacter sp. 71A-WALBACH]
MRKTIAMIGLLFSFLCLSASAVAQESWPSKPIKILIPFSPGALTDVIARMYGVELSKKFGVSVIIENISGAGGVTAGKILKSLPADGYTLMFVSSGHAVNPSLKKELPFNTLKDFSGVALVASSPALIIVNANSQFKTLGELIEYSKKNPDKLNYGSAGIGSATHLAGEYFLMETNIKLTHIPYKGVQEAVSEVFAQRIDTAFPPIALALPFINDGRIRALANTGARRSSLLPNVPTVAESGYKDFDYRIWYGFVMRSNAPKNIMDKFANEIKLISMNPEIIAKFESQGLEPSDIYMDAFDKYIGSEINKFGKIIKAAGIQPD